ncbi:hypothetical protein C1645_811201 [Glomus cerebriforme]|uniref:Uncharacterized protein n=1 Tax=Glomus cerebriforme TaxID=658196 RepID=A0A397TN54_9GLOM|nr:hypothetical protein C1645_811201 [Glomus cerebriforme]
MKIITEYQLSNSCDDRIIKLINNSQNFIDKNLLQKASKKDIDYNFYYQLIIHGIKVLLLQSDINKEFVFRYQDNNISIRTYSKQFESE